MVLRRLALLLVCLGLVTCRQAPAQTVYNTPSTSAPVVGLAIPLPQIKPGTLSAGQPPLPGVKPGTVVTVTVVETQPGSAAGIVDENIVLAPPVAPAGQDVQVQAGDTVYALSRRYGVAVRDIIQANNLAPPYLLLIGQTVRLPAQRTHVVRGGETIYGVSRLYGITTSELVRTNDLKEPYQLFVGQRLDLPAGDGSVVTPPATPALPTEEVIVAVVTPEPEPEVTAFSATGVPVPKTKPAPPTIATPVSVAGPVNAADVPARTGGKFSWPVSGTLLSAFGPKDNGLHNDGINISAPAGTPVFAAEDGVVAYVGDELDGYGNLVLLRHGDGWVTAYAHNADIRVARGQRVDRGQLIASVGTTGGVSGPQTHFEIRKGSQAVDPLQYLEPL